MILSLPQEKIDLLFESAASCGDLYIPVTQDAGTTDFALWTKGVRLSNSLKTVRSAKDFFFPKVEKLVTYKCEGQKITVEDPRKELNDFTVFGVRACDAASFKIVDNVYLNMEPADTYYKNRREHATVITLACSDPAQTCFCSAYGIDAAEPAGDVSSWLTGGKYFFQPNTEKGKSFLEKVKSLLTEEKDDVVCIYKKEIHEKIEKLPFAHLDLSKWKGKDMLKIFNSSIWADLASTCLGCGTCTYVCPTCMCFDVRDFDSGQCVNQFRCWDSCMHSDFTQMAAENPRHTQKERFRQRFMHKLIYYPMAHKNLFQCVGCGRCLESCPINMNIVKVINTYNAMPEPQGGNV